MYMNSFSLDTTCKKPIPRWPYEQIAETILGRTYDLSVQFVGTTTAKKHNQQYRKKDYAPDVLAFPLDARIGQIILTPATIEKKAAEFHMSPRQYTGYLFIHACLHLKGFDHGGRMDKKEAAYCAQFSIPHPTDGQKT